MEAEAKLMSAQLTPTLSIITTSDDAAAGPAHDKRSSSHPLTSPFSGPASSLSSHSSAASGHPHAAVSPVDVTSAGPSALVPQLLAEAHERKQPEPQIDEATGQLLECVSFSTGNPAVETIHGWLFVSQLPSFSHPPALLAAAQQAAGEPTSHVSQLSPTLDSALSVPLSAVPPRDDEEKWLTVNSRKARTVPSSPVAHSTLAATSRSPSLSSSTRPSPSLSATSSSLAASLPTPLSLSSSQPTLPLLSTASTASPSRLLCVWDVPAHVSVPEFHSFITDDSDDDDSLSQQLEHAQLVMRERSAQEAADQQREEGEEEEAAYCVLLNFHSVTAATSFLQRYNLRRYNEIEKDVCKISYLHHVHFDEPRHHFPLSSLSTLSIPPVTSTATATVDDLPLCPVCLEPLQPPTGPSSPLLTTLCLHHFHLVCLTGDHMVLTRSGWKYIGRIVAGVDEVASYNVATRAMEWKRVTATQRFPKDAANRLFRMQGRHMDIIATEEHRMLVARLDEEGDLEPGEDEDGKRSIDYETVDKLLPPNQRYDVRPESFVTQFAQCHRRHVLRSGLNTQPPYPFVIEGMEAVCEWWWQKDKQLGFLNFLGFWLGDGHLYIGSDRTVDIGQVKLVSCAWLIDLLDEVFPRWWARRLHVSEDGRKYNHTIRCPPLYEWLRVMACGPAGYHPGFDTGYPHFTFDERVEELEAQSQYRELPPATPRHKWKEEEMLAAFNAGPVPRPRPCHLCDDATGRRLFCSGVRCSKSDNIRRAHPACVGREDDDTAFDEPWLCVDCDDPDDPQRCHYCHGASTEPDDNDLLLCEGQTSEGEDCGSCAHVLCDGLTAAPEGKWICPRCRYEKDDAHMHGVAAARYARPQRPQFQPPYPYVPGTAVVPWNNALWRVGDGHWFHLKRWLGPNVAGTFALMSQPQAAALIDGFNRADGLWAAVHRDDDGLPAGVLRATNASLPLIHHVQLVGQLAGAAVSLGLHTRAGTEVIIKGRSVLFRTNNWQLTFHFTPASAISGVHTTPLGRPVDVSNNANAMRGDYEYEDDGYVYDISVEDNNNFLTQRLGTRPVPGARDTDGAFLGELSEGVRAYPVFVGNCLSQWADSTCPVCRFSLHPALLSSCSSCHHTAASSLWMCLLCGHVGCSRYIGGHAYKHWQESGHGYCLSVSTQRVWDYVREEYVHRLVRSKHDGKLVELRGGRRKQRARRQTGLEGAEAGAEADESFSSLEDHELSMSLKLEDMLIEYNYLLSSQLDKQRQYYQQQIAHLDRELSQRLHAQQAALQHLSGQQLALAQHLSALQAELADAEAELAAEDSEHARLRGEWDQLRRLNEKLSAKQAEVRAAVEKEQGRREEEDERLLRDKDAEISELEEQLRDLEFFVRTQKQVGRSGLKDDIQGGRVYVAAGEGGDQDDEKKAVRAAGKKKKKR